MNEYGRTANGGLRNDAMTRPWRARLTIALAIVTGAMQSSPSLGGPRNIKIGDPVGALKQADIDGRPVDTSSWSGAPSIWIFVSAEQTSSENALRDAQESIDGLAGANVRAVALTADAFGIPYFRQLRSRARIRLPIVLDAGRETYGRIGVIVLPTTMIIDKEGRLNHVLSGHDLNYRRTLEARLAFLAGRIGADELERRLATSQPARNEPRERAERHCRAAELMLGRGLRAEAAAELRAAMEADPSCLPAYLALAEMRAAEGDLAAAEKLVGEVTARDAKNRHAKLVLGMIRLHQSKLDEAEALLNEALLLNPNPTKTRYWLGRLWEARGDAGKAAEHYRAAVEQVVPELRPLKGR